MPGPGPKVHVDPRLGQSMMGTTMSLTNLERRRPEEKLVGAERVIAVLTELADHPLGVTLDELAGKLHSPKPTVHRALATLRRAGLADMTGRGVYMLGDEYLDSPSATSTAGPRPRASSRCSDSWPPSSARPPTTRCSPARTSSTGRRWTPRREASASPP